MKEISDMPKVVRHRRLVAHQADTRDAQEIDFLSQESFDSEQNALSSSRTIRRAHIELSRFNLLGKYISDSINLQTKFHENLSSQRTLESQKSKQQVLGSDVAVAQPHTLVIRVVQCLLCIRSQRQFDRRVDWGSR